MKRVGLVTTSTKVQKKNYCESLLIAVFLISVALQRYLICIARAQGCQTPAVLQLEHANTVADQTSTDFTSFICDCECWT